jgi:hypothetical protein
VLFALALALIAAGIAIAVLRDLVIRHWTSRYLGSLAPGYAADRTGVLVYAALVADLGLLVLSIVWGSAPLIVAAVVLFIGASAMVFVGEVRTYRALKR